MLCWGHCVRAWIDKRVTTWQHEGFFALFFTSKDFLLHVSFSYQDVSAVKERWAHMSLSHLKASRVDIPPDLAVFLSWVQPSWPSLTYLPHVAQPQKCAYASAAFGDNFHLGYMYYSLKNQNQNQKNQQKRQKEALGSQVCQVGMVQGSREITIWLQNGINWPGTTWENKPRT